MKTKFLKSKVKYDGTQLSPLKNYLQHDLLGTSCVAWVGACNVSLAEMKDGEDLKQKAKICGDNMLHFIFEIFESKDMYFAVSFQRLFTAIVKEEAERLNPEIKLNRIGDDLYFKKGKFTISIAVPSVNSVLIHFALNITNKGTPVPTSSLEDFKISTHKLVQNIFERLKIEYRSLSEATLKVKSV